MKKKHILQSKTALLNGLVAVISLFAAIDPQMIQVFIALIPNKEVASHIGAIVIAVIALINIYLRYDTKVPLRMR